MGFQEYINEFLKLIQEFLAYLLGVIQGLWPF